MVAWTRFPVPQFAFEEFKDMAYRPPVALSGAEARALAERCSQGDDSVLGAHVVDAEDGLYDRFQVKGPHRHAVLCLLPGTGAHLLARSHAWFIQRCLVLDSLDPDAAAALQDWRTPRPHNTRLGPENGVAIDRQAVYLIAARRYGDHWIGNRSIVQNDWAPGDGRRGFRVLAASNEDIDDFHDVYVELTWSA